MKIIISTTILLLAGCASLQHSKDLQLAPEPSLHDYKEISYTPIPQSEELEVKVDNTSQALAFPEGSSYFIAFKLPAFESGATFYIKTYMSSSFLPAATVFLPQILILDAEFNPLRVEKDLALKQEVSFFKGGYLSTSIPLAHGDEYLIIYTPATKLGQYMLTESRSVGYTTYARGTIVSVPSMSAIHKIPFVREGSLEIKISTEHKQL